jgi:hypothetical protein
MRTPPLILVVVACACSSEPKPAEAPARAPVAPPAPASAAQPADPNEGCAQIIVVAYRGAARAAASQTREKPEAEKKARALLARLAAGEDFAAIAAAESDAKSSAPRAGVVGTWTREDWPKLHAAVRDPVLALAVGATAPEPLAADYGYTIVRRCPVEKARSRHILVRYQGAKSADPTVKRSKAEARTRAHELLAKLDSGADFAELARAESDDSSKQRGGDIGLRGRGLLALPYEQALFALRPGQRSQLVESEFGFHVIERLPDTP